MDRLDMDVPDVIRKLVERIERLERAAPIGFSAVSRGALRITSEEGLIVEGSARISGVLDGDGQLLWSGPITFTGPFTINGATVQNGEYTVTGPFHVNGTTDINGNTTVNGVFDVVGDSTFTGEVTIDGGWHLNGDGDIAGNVGMTGTLTIQVGGSIQVGTVKLGVTSNGRPGLDFDGATLTENADRLALESGQAVVGVAPTFAALAFGSKVVRVSADGTTIAGAVFLPDLPTISGVSANVTADPDTGELGVI
jgi:cytoskeletal protein CcmA (bactofilin family)